MFPRDFPGKENCGGGEGGIKEFVKWLLGNFGLTFSSYPPFCNLKKKKVDDMNLLKKTNIVWKDGITFDENLFDGF